MTTLPITAPDLQTVLQTQHSLLSSRAYDRASAYELYDLDHALQVARWYIAEAEAAASQLPTMSAIYVYSALSDAVAFQFDTLTRATGITVRYITDDPYRSSSEMFDHFFTTGELRVFKTQQNLHPIWSDDENDRFRAVHDLLGHCAWRNSFGPKGEDAAYLSHAATLPESVLAAICSETRGQNATFNYGHLIDGRSAHQYAKQSWSLAPDWVWRRGL